MVFCRNVIYPRVRIGRRATGVVKGDAVPYHPRFRVWSGRACASVVHLFY